MRAMVCVVKLCLPVCHLEIWLEVDDGDNYFVVLDVRKTFVLLWTAFYADYPHQVRKKEKEYKEWLRLSGRVLTSDELIKNIMQRIND